MAIRVIIQFVVVLLLFVFSLPCNRADAASPITKRVLTAIRERTDLNALDKRGYGLLHHAAATGDTTAMRLLILKRAKLDMFSRKEGITPLGYAALYGKSAAVAYLLSKRANPKGCRGMSDWSPLYCAVSSGDSSSARMLVKAGANPNSVLFDKGKPRFILDILIGLKNIRAAEILIKLGASSNILNNLGFGVPPLLNRAVSLGDPNLVKAMLEKGADPNGKDAQGLTALHLAAGMGRADLVYLLLAKGASKKARIGAPHPHVNLVRKGKTAFITPKGLSKATMPRMVPALPKEILGLTPMKLARRKGYSSIAKIISKWRPGGRLPFIRSSQKLVKRVKTILYSSRALGRIYEGQAYERGVVGHWGFKIQVGFVRGRKGHFDGYLEWITLGSKHRVEGSIQSDQLRFSETKIIRKGKALLGTQYEFDLSPDKNPFPAHLRGTWKHGKRSGTVYLDLTAKGAPKYQR